MPCQASTRRLPARGSALHNVLGNFRLFGNPLGGLGLCRAATCQSPESHSVGSFTTDLSGVKKVNPRLDADKYDLLERSGGVDPLPHAVPEHRTTLESADALFQVANLDWVRAGRVGRDDRSEYARLVVRQLRCRKVGLLPDVRSSASIFVVGK